MPYKDWRALPILLWYDNNYRIVLFIRRRFYIVKSVSFQKKDWQDPTAKISFRMETAKMLRYNLAWHGIKIFMIFSEVHKWWSYNLEMYLQTLDRDPQLMPLSERFFNILNLLWSR